MVTAAASGDFQWLYPLRFFAAAGALWFLRKRYAAVDWSFGWFGPAMGVLAFALWLGMDALLNTRTHDAMPEALAATTPAIRTTWIAFRVLAAVLTVPIAEELSVPRLPHPPLHFGRHRIAAGANLHLAGLGNQLHRLRSSARQPLVRRNLSGAPLRLGHASQGQNRRSDSRPRYYQRVARSLRSAVPKMAFVVIRRP